MSTIIETAPSAAPPPRDDRHRIGWRDTCETLPNGEKVFRQIPLTVEDFLHPQDGDHFVESDLHDLIRTYLANIFRDRLADVPRARVISDVGVYWDDVDYGHLCPDIAVIFDVKVPAFDSFYVAEQETRPRLILELTSPSTRHIDLGKKFEQYHAVGIPYYIVVDREKASEPWTLTGYERKPRRYRKLPLDERGWLWLEPVGVWLAVEGNAIGCYDRAGKRLGDLTATRKFAEQEHERAEMERERAEAALKRAEGERERADAAEAKARELEAELARLRGPASPI